MSMPYSRLHALAVEHKPDLPIKPSSTWVAILLQSIEHLDDINSEQDFLWIKCHKRITIKTLRVQYWSRYPLGEIRLTFDTKFLRNTKTVAEIRALQKSNYPRSDKKHGQIVVLRALDRETAQHEKRFVADRNLKNSIRQTVGIGEAIIISDSEDESPNHKRRGSNGESADGTSNTSKSNDGSDDEVVEVDMNTLYRGLGAYTSGNANLGPSMTEAKHEMSSSHQSGDEDADDRMGEGNDSEEDQEMGEDGEESGEKGAQMDENGVAEQLQHFIRDDHTPEDYQLLMDADQLDPAAYQLMVESGQLQYSQPSNTNEAAQMLLDFSNEQQIQASSFGNISTNSTPPSSMILAQAPPQYLPAFVGAEQLQPIQQQALDFSAWYNCASPHCQRQMVLKPWTRFHATTVEPLCTECTRVFLRDPVLNPDAGALDHLEKQALVHVNEKTRRQQEGNLQNLDDDAPFDYPAAMRGPIALTSYATTNVDATGAMPQPDHNLNDNVSDDAMSQLVNHPNSNDTSQLAIESNTMDEEVAMSTLANEHETSNAVIVNQDVTFQLIPIPTENTNNIQASSSVPAVTIPNNPNTNTNINPQSPTPTPTPATPKAPTPKQSTWSTMFTGLKNALTRSPPKHNSTTSSNSNTEDRSGLQSPAHTHPHTNTNAVTDASSAMQDMLDTNTNTNTVDSSHNVATIGHDDRTSVLQTSEDGDLDTNIDDLIDEDSFAADPARGARVPQPFHLINDNDGDGHDEDSYDDDDDEEEVEGDDEDEETRQRDTNEYHAAMVEKVKVYNDESDEEYLDE